MSLATVNESGQPDVRMVLMKGVDERGFVFYTNLGSAKAKALQHEPCVALGFYWDKIDKQIRVRGRVERVSDEEADAYFATRQRLSQIGAWASRQSQSMRGYFELEGEVAKAALRFGVGAVPAHVLVRLPRRAGADRVLETNAVSPPRTNPLHRGRERLAEAMALSVG